MSVRLVSAFHGRPHSALRRLSLRYFYDPWLRMRTNGRLLWIRWRTIGFHKRCEISWLAEVLALQELCLSAVCVWTAVTRLCHDGPRYTLLSQTTWTEGSINRLSQTTVYEFTEFLSQWASVKQFWLRMVIIWRKKNNFPITVLVLYVSFCFSKPLSESR